MFGVQNSTYLINLILVCITWVIIVISIIFCLFMYQFRNKRKIKFDSINTSQKDLIIRDQNNNNNNEESIPFIKPIPHSNYDDDPELSLASSQLIDQFWKVLENGMVLLIHLGEKGSVSIQLVISMENKLLIIKMNNKIYQKIPLRDVKSVTRGKNLDLANRSARYASEAIDECCFSIVANKLRLNLEASSEIERDALVVGFESVIISQNI